MDMTQIQLCKKLGYNAPAYIYKLESGQCSINPSKMKRLAKVLDIPLEHIHKARVDDYDDALYKKLGLGR